MGTYVLKFVDYYLLCYFNTTVLLLNQIITMLLTGNHEYHTRNKDTINADSPNLISAVSKVESSLIQHIINLKVEVINLKAIIIKNLQNENKCLKK